MKMKSWFDNMIVLGNKYNSVDFTFQNDNWVFCIKPLFGRGYFQPEVGIGFVFNWWKDEETISITLNLLLVQTYLVYYPSGK